LRKLAKAETNPRVARRLLAIANALSGMSRKEAAEAAGMDRQTLRDWVIRYNGHGLDGLYDCWGDGRPPRLEPQEQAELIRIVLAGPNPETDGISAFTQRNRSHSFDTASMSPRSRHQLKHLRMAESAWLALLGEPRSTIPSSTCNTSVRVISRTPTLTTTIRTTRPRVEAPVLSILMA
jgi:transposase